MKYTILYGQKACGTISQVPNPRMEKAQKQVYEHNIMYYLFVSHVRMTILNEYCSFNIIRYQTRYHQSRLRKEYMYNPIQ